MHLVIQEKEYIIENDANAARAVVDQIQATVAQTGLLYSHMVVDGTEVYDDPEQYIEENLETLEKIQVVLVSAEQYLQDIFQTALDYVTRALPQLSALVDEFYRVPREGTWHALGQLVEGLQWFQQTESFIARTASIPEWAQVGKDLFAFSAVLTQLDEAVAQEDATMIGDIIQYEVMPRFETMANVLPSVVAKEGEQNGVN